MPLLYELQPTRSACCFGETPTTALFNELLAVACRTGDPMQQAIPVACLKRLIAARAWTDAALALVALQRPQWKLRRLVYDDGEWHCALSRLRGTPEWLDQSIEAHHPHMAMAILKAFLQVDTDHSPHLTGVPAVNTPADPFEPLLCENFA